MEGDRMSLSSMSSRQFERPGADIRKTGFMKKLKSHRPQTLKKKFFVLRSTSASGPARLEYYDSEKKFKSGAQPKRSIQLHTCFNINRRSDPSVSGGGGSGSGGKHGRFSLVLYLSDESFTVVAENEEDLESWLTMLLDYQNEYLSDGDMCREHYEFVWQVTLQARGLGKGTKGPYRLCLNDSTVCLVRLNSLVPQFAIPLVTIRSVAFSECIFRMEVGKYAPTGEGEFSLTVDDSSTAKDMHNTILHYMNSVKNPTSSHKDSHRRSSECQVSPGHRRPASISQRPASYYPPPGQNWSSLDPASPTSLGGPGDFNMGSHRTRSDTGDSRTSSHYDGHVEDFSMAYNGEDQMDAKEQVSMVPADMSPPSSPKRLDDEVEAYLEMDMSKKRQSSSSIGSGVSTPPSAATPMTSSFHSHKGELSTPPEAYIAMAPHHGPTVPVPAAVAALPPTAPIPIHTHSYSDPHHPTPLPTVREGGSNEGYVPMDSTSPASSYGSVVRPGPAKCMLSDDSAGMHPRTYSLGSKPPMKKYTGYVEMGPGGASGKGPNDMPRATSVPHIILKGSARRERDSPTTSASPLSMSLKSDDSADSFMEYMPMRPRTASDSFNYNRPRTASFGNKATSSGGSSCRPRSSSHGQGTRPFLGSRLGREVVKQEAVHSMLLRGDHHRVSSQTSSPHGSFDSLRVSNESLRRLSLSEVKPGNLSRQQSGSNASDYSDARGTPSPKVLKPDADGYVNMQPGNVTTGFAPSSSAMSTSSSSSHRIRTDSASSRRSDSNKTNSSDRLHHQNKGDYAEMAPLKSSGSIGSATSGTSSGEAYVSMDFRARHSFSSDTRPNMHHVSSSNPRQQSPLNQGAYINMDLPNSRGQGDQARSVSMENVDTYVMYDPAHPKGSGAGPSNSGKPRTGSLGSKDKKTGGGGGPRPGAGRKPSSNSMSSVGGSSTGGQYGSHSASMSTRTGGSSDSLRSKSSSASRQSSMEKYGSLGKDFRKKSASMGSRPVSKSGGTSGSKSLSFSSRGDGSNLHPREHYLQQQQQQQQKQMVMHAGNLVPIRKSQREMQEETADEYVEFAPTVTLQDADHQVHTQSLTPSSARGIPPTSSSGSFGLSRSPTTVPSLPGSDENDSGYTMYNPALPPELVASSSTPSVGFARMAQLMASPNPHPLPQPSYIHGQHHPPSSLPRQQHQHQPHQPHQYHGHTQSPSSPSLMHSQQKGFVAPTLSQQPAKDNSEYVGYEPGVIPITHHSEPPLSVPSSVQVKTARQGVEKDTDSEYVGYKPGEVSSTQSVSHPSTTSPGSPHIADTSEYVGYDPSKPSSTVSPSKPLSPNSAVSYIQEGPSKVSSIPGQPKRGSTIPSSSVPSAVSPKLKTGAQTPPSPSTASQSPTKPAETVSADDGEYMGYNPAVPSAIPTVSAFGQPLSESKFATGMNNDSCSMKENVMPTPTRAVSYIQGNSSGTGGGNRSSVTTPLKVDVGAGDRNTRASSTPPLSNNDNSPATGKNNKNGSSGQQKFKGEKQERVKQQGLAIDQQGPQQQHHLNVSFHRAMSSPSGVTAEFPSPVSQTSGQGESPSPSSSGPASYSRHKHSSGSSNSSQKSNRRVSSSSDSLRGDKKSDSNTSLNSSTSSLKGSCKRSGCASGWTREEGAERSLGGSLERSPLSPALSSSSRKNSGEFFCGEVSPLSSQQLEAKIVPVESRIRHSLGDMTTLAGGGVGTGGAKEGQGQQSQGLSRPGSTPCMHNLDSSGCAVGSGATTSTSTPCGAPGSLQFSATSSSGGDGGDASNSSSSRSRHSLSDLNSYQQQQLLCAPGAVGGGPTSSTGLDISGQSQQSKPLLTYVTLDLSAPQEVQSSGDNNTKAKSRNSSDADEKQPPLSYAEIDFVKSQNLSKALAMGSSSGDEPSKS